MNFRILYISAFLMLATTISWAQGFEIRGRVVNSVDNNPVALANITSPEAESSVITNENGEFTLTLNTKNTTITVLHDNFVTQTLFVGQKSDISIYMISRWTPLFYEKFQLPLQQILSTEKTGSSIMINKSELNEAYDTPEEGLHGKFTGLRVLSKSGMPGEGAYLNHRGIRSMYSSNLPLVIVDGIPYLTHIDESSVITGYSQSQFMSTHMKETDNISLIRGSDAAMYGSLGSNGIVSVTTEKAVDLDTRIEFHTVEGITFFKKRIPLLDANQFRGYMADIGETAYPDLDRLVTLFPYLKDDPMNHYSYIYNNNTNWQDEIYSNAITSENILKVKGGDAVANYAISVGYLYNSGVIKNTDMNKIYSRMNTDIKVTKNLRMFANAGFTYYSSNVMEQGMANQTNPLLTALHKIPLVGPYEKNKEGKDIGQYSQIAINGSYGPTKDATGVSNPTAIVNELTATSKGFNVLVNVGLNYDLTKDWKIASIFGLNYIYNREHIFIPGRNSLAIAPVTSMALNTVRSGVNESNNIYFNLNTSYKKLFGGVHGLSATVGYQLLTTKTEYDYAFGINTTSDFYKTLQSASSVGAIGRGIDGFTYAWNWMDFYANATYDYKKALYVTLGLTADASSSIGRNASAFFFYPSVSAGFDFKNTLLRDVKLISQLTLRGEYAQLPNSRYLSSYSSYQYGSEKYRDQTGIVRYNIPNTQLKAEVNHNLGAGLDFATYGRKFSFSFDVFNETTKGMLNPRELAADYGFGYVYDNSGEINTYGFEVAAQALLFKNHDFEWRIGASITTLKSKIASLGGVSERISTFSDGTAIINRVGEAPNQFYGYKVNGVISTTAQAQELNLISYNGYNFAPGDVIFDNTNRNLVEMNGVKYNLIDDGDRVLLGGATPDFYGGFNTSFKYRDFGLFAQFTYSKGNKIYNAVRRSTESMTNFDNQSPVALRRWTAEGQTTDTPRANYGDPAGNSRFSSRWVEDGSYLRLKYITLSYSLYGGVDKFFRQIDIYLTGENLLTATKYLGLDPEMSYNNDPAMQGMDLGKAPLAKTVRLGVKMNF